MYISKHEYYLPNFLLFYIRCLDFIPKLQDTQGTKKNNTG